MLDDTDTEEGESDAQAGYSQALRSLGSNLEKCAKILPLKKFLSIILDSRRNLGSPEYCWLFKKIIRGSGLDHAKAMLDKIQFDVNGGKAGSLTPLMASIKLHQVELVTLLLEKGADVNAKGPEEKTSLHYASYEGNEDVMRHILTPECDVNTQDKSGDTPLLIACRRGNSELAEMLLARGAQPDASNEHGMTPLHYAASVCNSSTKLIRLLLKKRPVVDINARSQRNDTPLMLAVRSSAVEKADILLKEGADCNIIADCHHHLPLHTAIWHGNKEMVKLLLNQACDDAKTSQFINSSGSQNTADALCIACSWQPQLIPMLLESKKLIPCGSNYQVSLSPRDSVAIHFPFESPWPKPFHHIFMAPKIQLATYKYDTPLALLLANHTQCGEKFMELLEMLLEAGAEVNPKECGASSPLVYYLGLPSGSRLKDSEHLKMLETLLSYGLDPDFRISSDECDFDGPDALAAACLNDPRSLAYFLHRCRTTPRQLLSHWTKLFEVAASRHMEVKEPYRNAIALRMSTSLKVILAYGQHDVTRDDLVGRFTAGAREMIALPIDVDEDELREMKKEVPTLSCLTRASLREFFSHKLGPEMTIKEAIYSVGLPYLLQDFLMYKDIDYKQFPSSYGDR